MSALCKFFAENNVTVSGSDKCKNAFTEELERRKIKVFYKHSAKNIKGADAVVYSSAIPENNVELRYAKRKKIPIFKRSEALSMALSTCEKTIAISGSHGKTTTTAMIADIFMAAGRKPTVFLGGESSKYGNFVSGDKSIAIAEACEFKKIF